MTLIEVSHRWSPRHAAPAEPADVVEQKPSVGRLNSITKLAKFVR